MSWVFAIGGFVLEVNNFLLYSLGFQEKFGCRKSGIHCSPMHALFVMVVNAIILILWIFWKTKQTNSSTILSCPLFKSRHCLKLFSFLFIIKITMIAGYLVLVDSVFKE